MLSILPEQITDESFAGYILRLSKRNGFAEPVEWLNQTTWEAITKNSMSANHWRTLNTFIPYSEKGLRAHSFARHSLIFDDYRCNKPRICALCIKELGYLKESWQYIGNLYCPKHKTLLIDNCPACNQSFTWEPQLLSSQCTNEYCANPLKAEIIPNEIEELFIDEICDCLLASIFAKDPLTTVLPHCKVPHFDNLALAIMQGFNLLTCNDEFTVFCNNLIENKDWNHLPMQLRYFPLDLLITSLQSLWPIACMAKSPRKRQTEAHIEMDEQTQFIVAYGSALNVLTIPNELLRSLPEFKNKEKLPLNARINIAPLLESL